MTTFSATHLTCRRGGRFVFSNLEFAAEPGDAVFLSGRNGSGKSSLLRMLSGLLPPYAGEILWDGVPISNDKEAHRARLTYVGHQDAVKPALTVRENLELTVGLNAGPEMQPNIENAIVLMQLTALQSTPGRYLSSGQKRRTALSRLFLSSSPIWLLDEPTVGLDTASCALLENTIQNKLKKGGIVIYSTHVPLKMGWTKTVNLDDFRRYKGLGSSEMTDPDVLAEWGDMV